MNFAIFEDFNRNQGLMTEETLAATLRQWAAEYEQEKYFTEDPIAFPKIFYRRMLQGQARLEDVEIAGIVSAHLAWGRRAMIVRDCNRAFDEMDWKPYDYVMSGKWEGRMDDSSSLHRTVRWSEMARICANLQRWYDRTGQSLEQLEAKEIRHEIYGRKEDPAAADKKIHMMRRWFVRRNSPVDLGIWEHTDPAGLMLPLDVHSHRQACELGLTSRKSKDMRTVAEITARLAEIFPSDPCRGDFALFGYGVSSAGTR